jgi:hypothetical protein
VDRRRRRLSPDRGLSAGVKTMPGWRRTSSRVIVIRSCCCRRACASVATPVPGDGSMRRLMSGLSCQGVTRTASWMSGG